MKKGLCFPAVGGGQTYPLQGGMLRCVLGFFAAQKASVKLKSRWPLLRAMRPVAEWRSIQCNRREPHQTREPRGLSPSGGKTPAKPHVPRAPCSPSARSPGCRGGERKRVSSGHNRRRRLATGSRQPKRGFDTAVSKTTIEVADFYPCLRGRRKKAAARRIRSGRATRRATPMVWLPTVREGRKALAAMMSSDISPVGTSSLRTAVRN